MFITQEGCGEGCSQGLPGVPGMAGAKGEKGDQGKPGATVMDSCDRVRLSGRGFLVPSFLSHCMILQTWNFMQCFQFYSHCCDESEMTFHRFALCSSVHGLLWSTLCVRVRQCSNRFSCLPLVFGETAEDTSNWSNGWFEIVAVLKIHQHVWVCTVHSKSISIPWRFSISALQIAASIKYRRVLWAKTNTK